MRLDTPAPSLSVVIVTLGGLAELAVPLPGLRSQTIADRIELIFVAERDRILPGEIAALQEFHSVRVVEKRMISHRGQDAVAGVAIATAPYIGLHENHTRAEPETYEQLLAAFTERVGAVCPLIYAANSEMSWGQAMYSVGHSHAAPPVRTGPQPALVLHHTVYRAEFLKAAGDRLKQENILQTELCNAGLELNFVPGTVVWHINEARPARVVNDCFTIGRMFSFRRAEEMGWPQRAARALAWPVIAATTVIRIINNTRRSAGSSVKLFRSLPAHVLAGLAFGTGEAIGYLDTRNHQSLEDGLHEFHIRGRLNGVRAAKKWLAEAIDQLPAGTP